jgi:hypothetical protein
MSIPTPLMVEPVGDLEDARRAASALRRSEPPPDGVETSATQPFETPIRARTTTVASRAKKKKRSNLAVLVVGALVLVGGIAYWRANAVSHATPDNGRSGAVTAPVTSTAPPPSISVAAPADPPREQPPRVPTTPSSATATHQPSANAAQRANVMFLGDPGTRVAVDGVPRGPCPTKLALESGQHDVRFTFDPTGESRGERLVLKPGDRVTVRADFAGATPSIRIHRQ